MFWVFWALTGLMAASNTWGAPQMPFENANSWAVLVAGSNGFYNYRHQADVCHAYHVLLNKGFSPDKIITMMYDDIAYSSENPQKGVIINKPGGTNVYAGVKIDYKGDDVTPQNFLNVLKGDQKSMKNIGTGRVVKSNHHTNIFVYFSDHGATGLIAFPNQMLMANQLESTLEEMHKKKRYNKLIMYIEACESGSMFDNILKENMNIYVMTAAARDESSYATYCNGTCLGDEFSVRWLEEMDSEPAGLAETFFHQFQTMRTRVLQSHVNIYGDLQLGANAIIPKKENFNAENPSNSGAKISASQLLGNHIDSRDVPLHYFEHLAKHEADRNKKSKALTDLKNLIKGRKHIDALFSELVDEALSHAPEMNGLVKETRLPINLDIFPCYTNLIKKFQEHCFNHEHEYLLKHYYKLANMCVVNVNTDQIVDKMPKICAPYKRMVMTRVL